MINVFDQTNLYFVRFFVCCDAEKRKLSHQNESSVKVIFI